MDVLLFKTGFGKAKLLKIMKNKYTRYKSEFGYSYTFGVFPTIELLLKKPDAVEKIILDERIKGFEGYEKIVSLCKESGIIFEFNDKFFKVVSNKDNLYAIGIFRKYESVVKKDENSVVLVNPADAGNLGTIIRTMVGFGVKNLALIRPAVDTFSPEVVRASMGAVFQINFEYFDSLKSYQEKYFSENDNVYYFTTDGVHMNDVEIKKPFVLVFGNEGAGLSESEIKDSNTKVAIPMSKDIDSYNLAVSVGIALYEVSK